MSEFYLSSSNSNSNSNKTHFSTLLLSDLFLFYSFILSHPLYFFYFIFFFPYLFKLLSFLSPLFFTTFLLLSVFLTLSPNLLHDTLNQSNLVSLLLGTYQALTEKLRDENGKEKEEEKEKEMHHQFEELDVYKIVFDTSDFDLEQSLLQYPPEVQIKEDISISISTNADPQEEKEEEKKANLDVVISIRCENETQKGEKEVKVITESCFNTKNRGSKVEETEYLHLPRANSERTQQNPTWSTYDNNNGGSEDYYTPKSVEKSTSMRSNSSFGSMRKEKEWRRTLACKLFEERHNNNAAAAADGSEGMDMLWETYESTDSVKMQAKKSKSKRDKKGTIECYNDEAYEDGEDEDDDEEESNAQLCCLQALKFSAGKMNLGMGKPNLLKISKAFKGIGWLHHVSKKKSSNYH